MKLNRETLRANKKQDLLHGKKKQADVYLSSMDGTPVVVKDYRDKGFLVRQYGRFVLWREYRNYRWLQQFDFIPRTMGRVDGLAFVIEFIDGPTVAGMESDPGFRWVPAKLETAVRELHRARFFHLDLRKRGNIMARDNHIFLIDFASSVRFGWYNPLYWLLGPILTYVDRSAVIKWKWFIDPTLLDDRDRRFLKRFEWTRMLWFFNKPRLPKPPCEKKHGD